MHKKKITTSREIGEKIKKRRKELKISQEELAETLGVTYQQVQRYENGKNKLNAENIQTVAEALNMPVAYFYEAEKASMIAESPAPYFSSDESRLLNYFRKIKNIGSKTRSFRLPALRQRQIKNQIA